MSESVDYNAESEDYKIRGGATPITGDNITGEEGELEMAIPAVRYPAGKKATAQDADLTAGNIKNGVNIFGVPGTHAPLTGDNVTGTEGELEMSIPAANYPAGKKATAQDADLAAANIKDGVNIFGVPGTHAPLTGDNVTGTEGELEMSIPAANYPAGKKATAQDADLLAANIANGITIFGVTGSLEAVDIHDRIFFPKAGGDDGFVSSGGSFTSISLYLGIGDGSGAERGSWVRLPGVSIPAGATITAAFLRMTSYSTTAAATCNVKCHLNNVDNAVAPTDYAEFMALALTAGVEWNALPGWVINETYDTPSLITEVQAIIDRVGWAADQAMMVVIKNNASSTNARRIPFALEQTYGSVRAELHVTWTE